MSRVGGRGSRPVSLLTCNFHPASPCRRRTPTAGQRAKSLVMPSVKVSLPDAEEGPGKRPAETSWCSPTAGTGQHPEAAALS